MIGLPNKKDATAAAGVGGCSGLLNKNNTTQLLRREAVWEAAPDC